VQRFDRAAGYVRAGVVVTQVALVEIGVAIAQLVQREQGVSARVKDGLVVEDSLD